MTQFQCVCVWGIYTISHLQRSPHFSSAFPGFNPCPSVAPFSLTEITHLRLFCCLSRCPDGHCGLCLRILIPAEAILEQENITWSIFIFILSIHTHVYIYLWRCFSCLFSLPSHLELLSPAFCKAESLRASPLGLSNIVIEIDSTWLILHSF